MAFSKRRESPIVCRQSFEARMRSAGWSQHEIDEELAETFGGTGPDGRRVTGSLEILAENSRLYRETGRFREPNPCP